MKDQTDRDTPSNKSKGFDVITSENVANVTVSRALNQQKLLHIRIGNIILWRITIIKSKGNKIAARRLMTNLGITENSPNWINLIHSSLLLSIWNKIPLELQIPVKSSNAHRLDTTVMVLQGLIVQYIYDWRHDVRSILRNTIKKWLQPTYNSQTTIEQLRSQSLL